MRSSLRRTPECTDSVRPMAGSILGTRVLRTEDPELLFGTGEYVGDLDLADRLHVVFVRSEIDRKSVV